MKFHLLRTPDWYEPGVTWSQAMQPFFAAFHRKLHRNEEARARAGIVAKAGKVVKKQSKTPRLPLPATPAVTRPVHTLSGVSRRIQTQFPKRTSLASPQ